MKSVFALALCLFPIACSSTPSLPPLETVPKVDLNRYVGTWYQIAYFPAFFQKSCASDTKAIYSARADGTIDVRNECRKKNGDLSSIQATARVIDATTNAKLKVKFFWFAPAGDYWVIDLGKNYEFAVVGEPKREYLWILSRTPEMNQTSYNEIIERARLKHFDVNRLEITAPLR
ncbi:MAG: lipocalin family protein [Cryobacterium sp.]|nr:lipocalin family protein [Oligoflexia bacterium]